jgi:hypothetical protein
MRERRTETAWSRPQPERRAGWPRIRLRSAVQLAALVVLTSCLPAGPVRPAAAAPAQETGLQIARLHYGGGGDWYCDPSSLPNWLALFSERTGIATASREAVVTLDDENLYRYPFLYLSGHGRIALSQSELSELRRYLEAGGFLYADDNYGLDRSFRQMVRQLYPDEELALLSSDHPIYRAFYDLPGLPKIHEHDGEPAQGFGVVRDGRLVIFYTYSSDIGDGLEDPDVHGDPPAVREQAVRMAVNVLMYALTHP